MPIKLISKPPKHSFYKMKVPGHPGLERVMTNSSDHLYLPEAAAWARDTHEGASFELQSPEDACIARLAQDHKHPTDAAAFDIQITRGLALVWFEKRIPVITIYTGIPHNLALTHTQKEYNSFREKDDWQVSIIKCRYIIALQNGRIRSYPGRDITRSTRKEVEHDPLTQDIFGEATPLVAKYLSDRKCDTLREYFPSIDGIKPRHARVRAVFGGGSDYGIYAQGLFSMGRARGVRVGARRSGE